MHSGVESYIELFAYLKHITENNMSNSYTKIIVLVAAVILMEIIPTLLVSQQSSQGIVPADTVQRKAAPMATSGDNNVYVTWSSNKTANNDEVMFKASTDAGKTFSDKMNLSNSPNSDSQDVQIAASGSNVYVSWWERNSTSNEPVMRVSNDNGKTFGEVIKLSGNSTAGAAAPGCCW
jgi:hypothetical protein